MNSQLQILAKEACSTSITTEQRILIVERLFRHVLKSGKLWRSRVPYYEDALQEALEYCSQNLEEYIHEYAELQTFMTWINDWIIKKLRLYRDRQNRQNQRHVSKPSVQEGYDPLQQLPASNDSDSSLAMWDELMQWIYSDPEEKLRSRVCKRFPTINAQRLLVRKLSLDNASWEVISEEFECPPSQAKYLAQWYSRYCYPLLRHWGIKEGYLNSAENT